jgi:hypothetical protein
MVARPAQGEYNQRLVTQRVHIGELRVRSWCKIVPLRFRLIYAVPRHEGRVAIQSSAREGIFPAAALKETPGLPF